MIVTYPNPILKTKCIKIQKSFDVALYLAPIMFEQMYAAGGIGLTANQIGSPIQLIVLNPTGDQSKKDQELIIVNPTITWKSRKKTRKLEGCLSIPGVRKFKIRPSRIEVKYQDLNKKEHVLEADGLLARVILHEADHMLGRLMIDD